MGKLATLAIAVFAIGAAIVSARAQHVVVRNANGDIFIRDGNIGRGYDANGRLKSTVIRRGNEVSIYDGRGRIRVKGWLGLPASRAKIYGPRETLP